MGRCLSPCLGDLDPNLYRRRLDDALALLGRRDPRRAIVAHVDGLVQSAAAEQRFERAAWLRRRRERLAVLLRRAGPGLAVTPGRPLLVLADSPDGDAWEAFWLVGGRVADWGAMPGVEGLAVRTAAALSGGAAPLHPREIAQARVAAAWVVSNEPHALELEPAPDAARIEHFVHMAGAHAVSAAPEQPACQGVRPAAPSSPAPSATSAAGGALTLISVP